MPGNNLDIPLASQATRVFQKQAIRCAAVTNAILWSYYSTYILYEYCNLATRTPPATPREDGRMEGFSAESEQATGALAAPILLPQYKWFPRGLLCTPIILTKLHANKLLPSARGKTQDDTVRSRFNLFHVSRLCGR